jgi:hypothetical protein
VRTTGARLLIIILLTGLFAAAVASLAVAQVQLPTVNLGDTNFEDGFAGPSWLLEKFPEGAIAGEMKDSNGKTVPGANRLTAYSTTTHVVFSFESPRLSESGVESSSLYEGRPVASRILAEDSAIPDDSCRLSQASVDG